MRPQRGFNLLIGFESHHLVSAAHRQREQTRPKRCHQPRPKRFHLVGGNQFSVHGLYFQFRLIGLRLEQPRALDVGVLRLDIRAPHGTFLQIFHIALNAADQIITPIALRLRYDAVTRQLLNAPLRQIEQLRQRR